MAKEPVLAYWDIHGIVEPIRILLHYKKVKFVDKRFSLHKQEVWQAEKFELGFDFPNLPYYIDGNMKLTQSMAILRYLARKHNLEGESEDQEIRVSIVEQQMADFRSSFRLHVVAEDFESRRPEFVKEALKQLELFEKFIGNGKFSTGDTITYVDFLVYENFYWYRLFITNIFDDFPKLRAFQQRMEGLPELQEYWKSEKFPRWPILGLRAKFGGGEPPKHV